MPIKHNFRSDRDDSNDGGLVQPSAWNEDHVLDPMLATIDNIAPLPNRVLATDGGSAAYLKPLSELAPTNSPALTGAPTAPTPPQGDVSTRVATMEALDTAIRSLIGTAPGALDTLEELATALGNDANFATAVTTSLASKAPLASPELTGTPVAPTPASGDDSTKLATTAFVQAAATAPAGSYFVSVSGSDARSGKSPQEAKLTIQAAIDAAGSNGAVYVGAGVYTLISAVRMRPGVKLIGANATLTQSNAANLSMLVDFATNAAHGASLSGFTIDGNRANNTDSASAFLVYVGTANDVEVSRNTLQNSSGYGVNVSTGLRPSIHSNKIQNVYAAGASIITGVPGTETRGAIRDNVFVSPLGQHAIINVNANRNRIEGNQIQASLVGGVEAPLVVSTSGTTVTWVSGPTFADVSPGMFLVLNGGLEYLVTAKASNTSLTLQASPGTLSGVPAGIGEGDLISFNSSQHCVVTNNNLSGGVTGGIVVSNVTGAASSCQHNVFSGNVIFGCGEPGISTQSVANGTIVGFNSYIGNHVVNCALLGSVAGPGVTFDAGINFIGSDIYESYVAGNFVRDYKGTPTAKSWMAIAGVGNGRIKVGSNASTGTTNPGIYGGITSVALSGWGTGASVSSIVSYGDSATFTITAGTAPSANPSFVVNAPAVPAADTPPWQCKFVSGTGAAAVFFGEQNSANGSVVAVYAGTPVSTLTYHIHCNS